MMIEQIDHIVLTVRDIPTTLDFYTRALGLETVTFKGSRKALKFGSQKINLHQAGEEFEPKAGNPTPGSADICFVSRTPLSDVIDHLKGVGVMVEEGPIARTGANGPITSIYIRDPDHNLIEIANY